MTPKAAKTPSNDKAARALVSPRHDEAMMEINPSPSMIGDKASKRMKEGIVNIPTVLYFGLRIILWYFLRFWRNPRCHLFLWLFRSLKFSGAWVQQTALGA